MARGVLLACVVVAFGSLAASASARSPVRATLTSKVSLATPPHHHLIVTWRLRDAAGRTVALRHVTLRIVCPTGDVSTTTVASVLRDGTYRANAVVPAGGIGMLSIRAGGRMLAITNW